MAKRSAVGIARCSSYDLDEVEGALRRCLDAVGGLASFIRPRGRVLLKVNALGPAPAERAVTTHPAVVGALCRLVKECGGTPLVGDSSAGVSGGRPRTARALAISGIAEAAEAEGAEVLNFDLAGAVPIAVPGAAVLDNVYLARPVVEADVVISVPKLKTHCLTTMTGAIKNMLGCVPGSAKPDLHRQFPGLERFSSALVDVYAATRTSLAVMDAVVAMEGNGPTAGRPRPVGLIIAGADPVAVDAVSAAVIGLDPLAVRTTRLAQARGLGRGRLAEIDVRGPSLAEVRARGFRPGLNVPLDLIPAPLVQWGVDFWRVRPEVDRDICDGCRTCRESCPVGAITIDGKRAVIGHDRCIDCLCCSEVCPREAIRVLPRSRLGRLLRRRL